MAQESPNSAAASPQPPAVWQWLMLSVVLVGGMAFLTAHAPPGWQRPGPTALWLAIVSGVFAGGIAVVNRIKSRRLIFGAAFSLIALAILGMTTERHRLYVKSLAELYLGSAKPTDPNVMAETLKHGFAAESLLDHEGRQKIYDARRPFAVFLKFRVEALGITEAPWPLVFWIGEILIGGLAGAFAAAIWHSWQTGSHKSKPAA